MEPTRPYRPSREPPGRLLAAASGRAGVGWATRGLLVLALFYTLAIAESFFFPIVLALLLNLLLRGPVGMMRRLHVPKPLGAALLLAVLLGGISFAVARFRDPASDLLANAPRMLRKVERKLREIRRPVEEATQAAKQVEQLTSVDQTSAQHKVQIQEPSLAETVLSQLPTIVGQVAITVVLVYLLLVFDELILLKLIATLRRWRDKRRAVVIAHAVEVHVSRYLQTITIINFGLGVAVGTALQLLGMPNPWLWAIMAGLLNFIPYVGGVIGVSTVALVALVSFPDLGRAIAAPAAYTVLNSLEGMVITPIILGRRFSLNPVMIFLWLFLWGWMWGIAGALIAIPLLTTLKIVCDHLPTLRPLGEFLGH